MQITNKLTSLGRGFIYTILLSCLFFLPIKAFGSENSHASFKVENVGPIEELNGKITGILPSTNELNSGSLVIMGILLLLLILFFYLVKRSEKVLDN